MAIDLSIGKVDHEVFRRTRHFGSLDGLRAVSVIAVVWHHTAGVTYRDSNLLSHGHYGVDFFFAISGFLITTLLLRERRSVSHISLRHFYIRRALRIFPLYYAVLSVYVLVTFATRRHTPEGRAFFENLPAFATYTSNWFVELTADVDVIFYFAWSLATEEQFYLVWPPLLALVLALDRTRLVLPLSILAALAAASITATHALQGDHFAYTVLRSVSVPIVVGAIGAVLLDDRRCFDALAPVLGAVAAAPLLIVALFVAVGVSAPHELVQVVMALIVLACCIRENTVVAPVLEVKPLVWIGTISYGVYLMHMLAKNAVEPFAGEFGLLTFIATLAVVTFAASMSYKYFESPILRFKDRVAGSRVVGHPAAS